MVQGTTSELWTQKIIQFLNAVTHQRPHTNTPTPWLPPRARPQVGGVLPIIPAAYDLKRLCIHKFYVILLLDVFAAQCDEPLNFTVATGYIPIDWYFRTSQKSSIFYEITTQQGYSLTNMTKDVPIIFWF